MFKKIWKRLYNLNIIILLELFIAGIFACLVCIFGVKYVYKASCEQKLESEISGYATRISNQLVMTDYLSSTNSVIEDELTIAAELYEGRVLVVNSSYQVIFDTFKRATGKTVVLNEIISTYTGSNYSDFNWVSNYGTYCHRITTDNSTSGCILFIYSMKKECETLDIIMKNAVLFASVIIIVLMLVGYFVGRRIAKPVRNMKTSLNRISAGDITTKLDEDGIWEFGTLATSINETMVKVRATEESQQEFVSNVSHELKTPMTSMKVLADSLLMMEGCDEATYREFLTDINEQIDRENQIIQDLLQLVKLDKKADGLNISQCSVNDIMNIVLKRVKPLAENKHIELIYESYRGIKAEVDDAKLIMALTNFVENAVKYNNENGQVRVGLNADARYVYITVEDNGFGIPEEAVSHIFERFYRVDKARARETGGTGLGLSIAYEIISMHDGEIKVHSVENQGTIFSIRIPLRATKKGQVKL